MVKYYIVLEEIFIKISGRKNLVKNRIKKKDSCKVNCENVSNIECFCISNCSRDFLFTCGDFKTVYFCIEFGNAIKLHRFLN